MPELNASPPEGGQGAPPVSPPAAPPVENNASPPAAPPPPVEAPKAFYADFKNPELRGYAEKKGFPGAEELTQSYMNLEKFHGVPADRLIKLPENVDDAEAIKPIMEKLGYVAPKEASEYGFADMEGADPEFSNTAAGWMHELGVPARIAQPLAQKWNAFVAAKAEADAAAQTEQVAVEMGHLKAEWGQHYDERLETAKRFIRKIGFTEEQLTQIEQSAGSGALMRNFFEAGKLQSEAPFIDGRERKSDAMSPAAARAEITALKLDAAFFTRLMAKEQGAVDKWNRLNQIAASDQGATP